MKRILPALGLVIFVATALFSQPINPDIKKLDKVLPALGEALLQGELPKNFQLSLEEYKPYFLKNEGADYYTEALAEKEYARQQEKINSSIRTLRYDLSDARAVAVVRWDTVKFQRLEGIWFLDAMLVYRVKPNAKGIAKDFPIHVRFMVCNGLIRVCAGIGSTSEYEFQQAAAKKWRYEWFVTFYARYMNTLPKVEYSGRKPSSYGYGVYASRISGLGDVPTVHLVTKNRDKDTLALLKNYTSVEWIDDHLLTERNDTIRIQDYKGNVSFETTGVTIARWQNQELYVMLMDNKTRLFGLYEPRTRLYIKPQYRWIEYFDRKENPYAVVLTHDYRIVYIDDKGNPMKYEGPVKK